MHKQQTHTNTHIVIRKIPIYLHHPFFTLLEHLLFKMANLELLEFLPFIQVFLVVLIDHVV